MRKSISAKEKALREKRVVTDVTYYVCWALFVIVTVAAMMSDTTLGKMFTIGKKMVEPIIK